MTISAIALEGYKTFGREVAIDLHKINVLIGANGSGKSNFMSIFRLLASAMTENLQLYVQQAGGPDALLHRTRAMTERFAVTIAFDQGIDDLRKECYAYSAVFAPTNDNRLIYAVEQAGYFRAREQDEIFSPDKSIFHGLGFGHAETMLSPQNDEVSKYVYAAMLSWCEYHFHDTSDTSKIKQIHGSNDNVRLQPTGRNLAAYLAMLKTNHPDSYADIVSTIQLTAPFFGGFFIRDPLPVDIELEWYSREDPHIPNRAHLLSDGTLRFICLTTLLLQPHHLRPATILIDEPELGLHPHAIVLLTDMIKQAAEDRGKQVILSTQSCEILNAFTPKDIVTVERQGSMSVLKRLDEEELKGWLEDYSLAELWKSNVIGGGPTL